ncbi:uncharacterized protein LOC134692224 [Mytilus trossulus]|uniref:uncharacterized protein LOC134692224 n=1 Tax=Mytilus trossulus TaxID=6551 RepID=UPI0030055F1B
MASNALSQEEENYVRMTLLLTGISPRAVRFQFDKEFPPTSLSFTVNDKNGRKKLNDLRRKRVVNQAQWDLLFPCSGVTDSKTFDVTLMIALLRNLTTSPLVPPINGYDKLPVSTETTPSSDLARIKHYRNFLAHLHDGKVDSSLFTTAWNDISNAVFRLGGKTMKQECDQLITKPLDMSSQEIVRDLHQASKDIQTIKQSIDLIQTYHKGVKEDIEILKEDVTTIQMEQDSLRNSHQLLQFDHLDTKMDVLSLQIDYDMLKKSHDLHQVNSVKTRTDLKELTSIHEEYVPKNRRALIDQLLDEWQKNRDSIVETRAMKAVLECVLENSCVTITASSGAGKTSTLLHVALKMKEEGYTILPVTNPNDIVQFCNPNQKTLFVIDDFCGTYSINQSDLDSWEPVMKHVKVMMQNKRTKIIVACRLQVYQDKKFESLSMFRTCVCNLLCKDLCLLQTEKKSIAELYLDTKASKIIQFCDLYDCFPLLCKLSKDNPELNIIDFFKNPFSVYTGEIDKLDKNGYNGKFCGLALLVMFNNKLEEKWLTEEIDHEKSKRIKNTCEASRLAKGTSRLFLLDELNSLEETFIKKEQGVFKTKHDKCFDLLACYFGQKMIQCLIKNAHPLVIMQRFLLERKDDMDQFITIVPTKYHQMYIQRMIDDWSIGRVHMVFNNINMKIPNFRHRFLFYLNTLDSSLQKQLSLTCDLADKSTVLIQCCFVGEFSLIQWCINHGADINKSEDSGASPLFIACQNNHIDVVKILLDRKADFNKCVNSGVSPLYAACFKNHLEVVTILLDRKADINKCDDSGASPLYISCQKNHLKIVKIFLDRKADINKCVISGESPLYIACQKNHLEIVKILLDRKADINKCRYNKASPLYIACFYNHIEVIKLLLDRKADINKCVDSGASPLYIASYYNHIELVNILLDRKADINKCTDSGESPLYISCQNNHTEVVKTLLDRKADIDKCRDYGVSPLYIASYNNHLEVVKILLERKADIDKCEDSGASPLYIACQNNHIEVVKILLDRKADINKCRDTGASPLHIACQNNYIEVVNILLDSEADIDTSRDSGATPLYIACQKNNFEAVEILLHRKIDINKCENSGASPLYIACQNNRIELVKILLDKKADINKCRYTKASPLYIACYYNHIELVKLLLDRKADINKCRDTGLSPLYIACENNYIDVVKILLDRKADINKCEDSGASPLYIACQNNHIEVVKILLDRKADINKCRDTGASPLYIACRKNYKEVVNILLERKAYINERVISGATPLLNGLNTN